ncbi:MAG TPA: phage holin family protein [Acidimicrobiia bacterium]|nr:phage holin family protein [Acidimicrobiia bacterium]
MADPKELPRLVTELLDMSKEYLRQETVEPAKKLGRFAGVSLAAGFVFAVAALFGGLAAYALYRQVLPEGDWWVVLARGLTVLTTGAVAGLIGWRLTKK